MKVDKKKPFVEMSPAEFEASWDQLELDGHFRLLEEARKGEHRYVLVVAVLNGPNLQEQEVLTSLEYGDGEGVRYISEFVKSVERQGLLLPGEKLTMKVLKITGTERITVP